MNYSSHQTEYEEKSFVTIKTSKIVDILIFKQEAVVRVQYRNHCYQCLMIADLTSVQETDVACRPLMQNMVGCKVLLI
jgi:hypothetical protein